VFRFKHPETRCKSFISLFALSHPPSPPVRGYVGHMCPALPTVFLTEIGALSPAPRAISPGPCTTHLLPCTLHLAPYTLHPAPCTQHPVSKFSIFPFAKPIFVAKFDTHCTPGDNSLVEQRKRLGKQNVLAGGFPVTDRAEPLKR
jgi:hypothetical protein